MQDSERARALEQARETALRTDATYLSSSGRRVRVQGHKLTGRVIFDSRGRAAVRNVDTDRLSYVHEADLRELAVDPSPSGASPQAEELRAANVANLREMVVMAGRHRETLLAVRECILALSPGHRTGYDWNADPLYMTRYVGDALKAIDAGLKSLNGQAAVPTYRHVYIVTHYPDGGLRGVHDSQAGAEAEIAELCREYPEYSRRDFSITCDRIRPFLRKTFDDCGKPSLLTTVAPAGASEPPMKGQVRLCGALHLRTGAVCELPLDHGENHRGSFSCGIAQWPYFGAHDQPAPVSPVEPEPPYRETPAGDRIFRHTCGTPEDDGECMACGQIDCPDREPLHYHHDGCPCCSQKPTVEPEPCVWRDIRAEVERATAKFPTWPTDPLHALAVLGEEFGELTKAVVQQTYEPHKNAPGELRQEAIQTAAMALRFAMSIDDYMPQPSDQHSQVGGAPLKVER